MHISYGNPTPVRLLASTYYLQYAIEHVDRFPTNSQTLDQVLWIPIKQYVADLIIVKCTYPQFPV